MSDLFFLQILRTLLLTGIVLEKKCNRQRANLRFTGGCKGFVNLSRINIRH